MSKIEFTSQQKQRMATFIQDYLTDELEVPIGQFDAEFLCDFIISKLGPVFYNKGLWDAQALMQNKMLDIADEIYDIEQIDELN